MIRRPPRSALLPYATVFRSCSAASSEREAGVTETMTGGLRVIVAVADLEGSAALVAVTVTVWVARMEARNSKRPASSHPPTPAAVYHLTAVLVAPVTTAVAL